MKTVKIMPQPTNTITINKCTIMRPFYLAITSLLFLVSTGCRESSKQVTKKTGVDSVAVFVLTKEPVNKQVSFPSELVPAERADIYAKVSGYIKSIKVDIGDHVREGQVLAILDAPEAFSNYAQSNAEVQTARSKYLGSLDIYNRIEKASKVEGTVAASELEKARSQMLADSSSLDAARSKMNSSAQLKDYLTIRSPFNGVVTQRNVDAGTLVGINNPKPLLVVEDNATLRLRVPIPEAYTSAIPDSSFVNFTVDAQPNVIYKAALSRKAGSLNLINRTETWEFTYPNTGNQLKSGMYANASIKLGRKDPSFLVPSSAIVTNLEKRFVIRLTDGKTEWIDVRNGMNMNDKTEVFGNLSIGDTLLLRATDEIKSGIQIVPKVQNRSL
jgi:membrane fusion protein (multidrug efflux system)